MKMESVTTDKSFQRCDCEEEQETVIRAKHNINLEEGVSGEERARSEYTREK